MAPHKSGLGAHVPFPEYLSNMKKIALHLKSLSNKMRMIFLTTPPVDEGMVQSYFGNYFDGQERKNESCRIYAEGLVDLCKQLDIKVINLWTAFQDRHDWGATYLTDGIHLTTEGSKVMVREILKVLREAEWEPSLYWLSMPTEFGEDSTQYPIDPYALSTINVSRFIASWKTEWMNEKELEEHNSKSSIHIPF